MKLVNYFVLFFILLFPINLYAQQDSIFADSIHDETLLIIKKADSTRIADSLEQDINLRPIPTYINIFRMLLMNPVLISHLHITGHRETAIQLRFLLNIYQKNINHPAYSLI